MLKNTVNYTNIYVLPFLCVAFQCLIISDANIHAASNVRSLRSPDERKEHSALSSIKNITHQPSNGVENKNLTVLPVITPNVTTPLPGKEMPVFDSKLNPGALLRGFYVFVGLGAIVVMYIVVRTIRLRRKKTTIRKYGILASREDVEMTPLGAEDEDEDTTLFDVNNHSRP